MTILKNFSPTPLFPPSDFPLYKRGIKGDFKSIPAFIYKGGRPKTRGDFEISSSPSFSSLCFPPLQKGDFKSIPAFIYKGGRPEVRGDYPLFYKEKVRRKIQWDFSKSEIFLHLNILPVS
ncbi:MAG TPA: hypothetical protein PK303_05400 [bacterium]|nr:hypothetical protein [bacterium]HOL35337.1 hypothetical protein [bacterium]HPP08536.1 hypothetical protein [bacterium]